MTGQTDNPCQRCGACCASFRVSFYWSEADVLGLPASAIEQAGPLRACMAGTNTTAPRCVALRGTIGGKVDCTLYSIRPSPCREVQSGDEKCGKARAKHGLHPLDMTNAAPAQCRHHDPGRCVPGTVTNQ
jgi:uncharacterized protein